MRGSATILGLILLVWVTGSVWWYTCKIKENCISFFSGSELISHELIIDLEGEDMQTFHLKNAGNGILQVMPGKEGNAIGIIRSYLNDHPEQEIDLVAQNEDHSNGLLAMMIISGVPNNRVNVFIDASLGSKDRPMTIRSTFQQEEIAVSSYEVAVQDSFPGKESMDSLVAVVAEPPVEVATSDIGYSENDIVSDVVEHDKTNEVSPKKYVWYDMPCPKMDNSSVMPTIESIYYPTAAYKVRCSTQLALFAKAAATYVSEHKDHNLVIIGFTDDNQEQVNNYQLALKRAVEIKKYLIKRGIPGHRIETYSRGADAPVADNNTAEGKKLNRRVTIQWN